MATGENAGVPQRLLLEVPVPQRLSDETITQLCDTVSARLRYLLSCEFQRRSSVRLQVRIDARKAARAARLDAAARRAEAEEAQALAAAAQRRRVTA
ncbi:hypothetical protein [Mycobacterium palustre]|uniref:Uncharacterized protein n=1 Tax=Mycobacterium palustre TaxID=153971 RepID=A0A1X1ZPI6_9MYCO|nr:hypothetical protein [Mycobacterium palustre]ORW25168.1 hypothetical protein AWC19_08245 [Mycobacterium palustre]